jgi:sugar lactone lactonase YvrE
VKLAIDLTVDGAGNLYISDNGCDTILRATADSLKAVWSTSTVQVLVGVAGTPGAASWVAPGGAIPAPRGLTVDSAGNIYFTDGKSLWFYDVNTKNTHAIVSSGFVSAYSISHDAHGNIYAADSGEDVVWQIPTNTIFPTTAAGSASAAQTITVHYPAGYAAPSDGSAFVSTADFTFGTPACGSPAYADNTIDCNVSVVFDPSRIGWVNASVQANSSNGLAPGTPAYFALSGTATGAVAVGDPGSATTILGKIGGVPNGVAVDRAGNVYVADAANNQILKFASGATSNPTVIAGNGAVGYTGDGNPATLAELYAPRAVAVDPAGNVYIADTFNNAVRRVDAITGVITTAISSALNASALTLSLNNPLGIAADANGNVYVADTGNNRILVFDPRSQLVNTFAGGGATTTPNGGPCTPGGITLLNSARNAVIYSTPTDDFGDGCDRLQATLNGPTGLAVDGSGDVYIADAGNSLLRVVNADTGVISSVPGPATLPGVVTLTHAPESLALDTAGNIYYLGNDGNVYMLASGATSDTSVEVYGQTGSNATLSSAAGVAFDGSGVLYVTNSGTNTILAVNRLQPEIFLEVSARAAMLRQRVWSPTSGTLRPIP